MINIDNRIKVFILFLFILSIGLIFFIIPTNNLYLASNQLLEIKSCEYSIYEIKDFIDENYLIKQVSISFFPEVNNLKCFGKVDSITKQGDFYEVKVINSQRLLTILQSIIFTIYLIITKYVKKASYKLLIVFQFIVFDFFVFNFFVYPNIDYFFYFIKLIFFTSIVFIFNNEEKNNILLNIFIVTLNAFIYWPLLIRDIQFNRFEIPYFLPSIVNSENSSYFGESSPFIYSLSYGFVDNLLGTYSKLLYYSIALIWFVYVLNKFKDIFRLNSLYLFFLSVLILYHQSFMGGEYFYGQVVPKSFSYLSVFTSLIFLLENKTYKFLFFSTLSLYIHFQVGLLSVPIVLYFLFNKYELKKAFNLIFTGLFLSLPVLYINFSNLFLNEQTQLTETETKYFINNLYPHHLKPFEEDGFFNLREYWESGFTYLLLFIIFVIFVSRFDPDNNGKIKKQMSKVFYLCLILVFLTLLIIYLNPYGNFVLLYPFKFLIYLKITGLIIVLISFQNYSKNLKFLNLIFIIIVCYFQINRIDQNINNHYSYSQIGRTPEKIIEFFENTETDVVILPLYDAPSSQSELTDFEFRTKIPVFHHYKNIPGPNFVDEWKNRNSQLVRFYDGECSVFQGFGTFYFIDYAENNECGNLVTNFDEFFIYESK